MLYTSSIICSIEANGLEPLIWIQHIILFKSLRDIQQIDYLGKQLNCLQLIKEAYKLANAEPFGHLIIDLHPKISHRVYNLRHILLDLNFYIHSEEAVVTPISNEKETFACAQAMGKKHKQELQH